MYVIVLIRFSGWVSNKKYNVCLFNIVTFIMTHHTSSVVERIKFSFFLMHQEMEKLTCKCSRNDEEGHWNKCFFLPIKKKFLLSIVVDERQHISISEISGGDTEFKNTSAKGKSVRNFLVPVINFDIIIWFETKTNYPPFFSKHFCSWHCRHKIKENQRFFLLFS